MCRWAAKRRRHKSTKAPHQLREFQYERPQRAEDRALHVLLDVQAGQAEHVEEIRVTKGRVGRDAILVTERRQFAVNKLLQASCCAPGRLGRCYLDTRLAL